MRDCVSPTGCEPEFVPLYDCLRARHGIVEEPEAVEGELTGEGGFSGGWLGVSGGGVDEKADGIIVRRSEVDTCHQQVGGRVICLSASGECPSV